MDKHPPDKPAPSYEETAKSKEDKEKFVQRLRQLEEELRKMRKKVRSFETCEQEGASNLCESCRKNTERCKKREGMLRIDDRKGVLNVWDSWNEELAKMRV